MSAESGENCSVLPEDFLLYGKQCKIASCGERGTGRDNRHNLAGSPSEDLMRGSSLIPKWN